MKFSAIISTLAISFVMLTGCASRCNSPCAAADAPCNTPAHHDLKGEVSSK